MEKFKALEILKTIRNTCKVITPIGNFYNYEKADALINEAIAELEALQAPKKCEGCSHYGLVCGVGKFPCAVCERNWNDHYEPIKG